MEGSENVAGPSRPTSKPATLPVAPFDAPDQDEERTVHAVYEAIAPHFSQTRHKTFLHSLPPGSIGLDSGAGNGKYLPTSRDAGLEMIALDRSSGLLGIARGENGGECVRADLGFAGWRGVVFTLLRPLRLSRDAPRARFMIYVWAYEQGQGSKRKMGQMATGGDKVQDVLVPWVYSQPGSRQAGTPQSPQVFHRYYHLFVEGELKEMVLEAGALEGFAILPDGTDEPAPTTGKWLRVRGVGWEADNWWLEGEVGVGVGVGV
ncbi:hypothetical protein IAU60_006344 [Kwoniella sp. DSM 27419]